MPDGRPGRPAPSSPGTPPWKQSLTPPWRKASTRGRDPAGRSLSRIPFHVTCDRTEPPERGEGRTKDLVGHQFRREQPLENEAFAQDVYDAHKLVGGHGQIFFFRER